MAERVSGVALSIRAIEKSFGPVSVLRGVTFDVAKGHVHALLGANGAGKSTLMKILVGLEKSDRGEAHLFGAPYLPGIRDSADARAAGVVMVPQERTLCPHLDVLSNLVLGVEPLRSGFISRSVARDLGADALLLAAGKDSRISLAARAGNLPVADQQLVEIARALVATKSAPRGQASLLILDEPTSSLGHHDAARLFERIRALADAGVAVLLVTHFLNDVRAHADRYTVLRDGLVAGEGDPKVIAPAQIVREMLGRDLEEVEARGEEKEDGGGEVVLRVEDLAGMTKPRRVSFALRRGEIFGVAGLVGSGRTDLLRAIVGLDDRRAGRVLVLANRGMGLASEDRGGEGLMLAQSIADNIALSPRGPWFVSPKKEHAVAVDWMKTLAVRASGPAQRVSELSGGNQQKIQLARMLREDYDVLLVDEPTRGIDVGSKAAVLDLFRELAHEKNKAIVLVSSQLEELLAVCDRIAILREGELSEARPASSWNAETLLLEASS